MATVRFSQPAGRHETFVRNLPVGFRGANVVDDVGAIVGTVTSAYIDADGKNIEVTAEIEDEFFGALDHVMVSAALTEDARPPLTFSPFDLEDGADADD